LRGTRRVVGAGRVCADTEAGVSLRLRCCRPTGGRPLLLLLLCAHLLRSGVRPPWFHFLALALVAPRFPFRALRLLPPHHRTTRCRRSLWLCGGVAGAIALAAVSGPRRRHLPGHSYSINESPSNFGSRVGSGDQVDCPGFGYGSRNSHAPAGAIQSWCRAGTAVPASCAIPRRWWAWTVGAATPQLH